MGILQIAPVTRTGMRFIISLYGMSETGKTLSALKLAAGIEPDPRKRGLLDTEGGQRGRAYVDHISGGYMYAKMSSPFTPERYIEALGEFEAAGVSVLTIDSISHAWFAEGGVLDMVETATESNDMAKWAKPKRRLGKLTRRILSSDMHIILCSRGKQPLIDNGKGVNPRYTPGPVTPIQEKTLRFDMTIMAQMLGDGKFTVAAPAGKCPGALRPIFAANEVMNEEMGRKLGAWIQGEDVKPAAFRQLEIAATAAADEGADAFRAFWKDLDAAKRDHLKPNLANYQSIAKAADDEAERSRENDGRHPREEVDDPFGSPVEKPELVTDADPKPPAPDAPKASAATGWQPQVLPRLRTDGNWNAWRADAVEIIDNLPIEAFPEVREEMDRLGMPDIIHSTLVKAMQARASKTPGKRT